MNKELYPAHEQLMKDLPRLPDGWNRWMSVRYFDKSNQERHEEELHMMPVEMFVTEFQQLLASYQALKDAVIVLEDDAEPEVGDVVEFQDHGRQVVMVTSDEEDADVYEQGLNITFFRERNDERFRIIQRSGKPVIYRSQLGEKV